MAKLEIRFSVPHRALSPSSHYLFRQFACHSSAWGKELNPRVFERGPRKWRFADCPLLRLCFPRSNSSPAELTIPQSARAALIIFIFDALTSILLHDWLGGSFRATRFLLPKVTHVTTQRGALTLRENVDILRVRGQLNACDRATRSPPCASMQLARVSRGMLAS